MASHMTFSSTEIEGVVLIESQPIHDERGFFARTFCGHEFAANGLNTRWVQHNHSLSFTAGTLRGLHYQSAPHAEVKLVRCLSGRVWDVVVDLRRGSSTFGRWEAHELSESTMRALYIPAGCAHGFQCLTDSCQLFYLMSEFYESTCSTGVRWDDPELAIQWPLPPQHISPRDQALPLLKDIG
jgi:dTDP-4-dehydrorhamnose 3,5-epimerase